MSWSGTETSLYFSEYMSIVLFNRLSIQHKAVFLIQYKFMAYLRYVSKYQCSDFLFEFAERIVAYETKFFGKQFELLIHLYTDIYGVGLL